MATYAEATTVPVEKSRMEIEMMLRRYGGDGFAYQSIESTGIHQIGFRIKDQSTDTWLAVRMTLALPPLNDPMFQRRPYRGYTKTNSPEQRVQAWEQFKRSRWRSLALVIKAKLEACAAGISTVEREFLPDVVTSNGMTIGEHLRPQLAEIYAGNHQPLLA